MSFWDFIVMLGRPAQPLSFEKNMAWCYPVIADLNPKERSMMDMLKAAERDMRNDRKEKD